MKIVCSLALMPIASLCFVQREPKEEEKSFGDVMEDNKLLTMAYFLDEIVSFYPTQKWSWSDTDTSSDTCFEISETHSGTDSDQDTNPTV